MSQFRFGRRGTRLVLASAMATACSGLGASPADFSSSAPSGIASGATPWTSMRFDDAPTDVSFAVVTDKTGHVPAGGERLCLSHGGPLCPAPH